MNDTADQRGIKGFLNKGGFWRLLLVLIAYMAIYLGASRVPRIVAPDFGTGQLLDSLSAVFVQLTFALIVGSIALAIFTRVMGWNAEIYGRQPIYKSGWMWIAPVVALTPIVLRAFGIEWDARPFSIAALVLFSGLLVGFTEELLCRGIAVKMLRSAGHREFSVAGLSALVFAMLHLTNLLSGQALLSTGIQLFYTFGFGVIMYLSMRVSGFIVVAMVLHGLTDPMGILSNGGIGDNATVTDLSPLLTIAGQLTLPIGFIGLILLLFVRGKVGEPKGSRKGAEATAAA